MVNGSYPVKHRPASHPVLSRSRQGVVSAHVWQELLVQSVEEAVTDLTDADLSDELRDRYERALERGHRENLRWVRQA